MNTTTLNMTTLDGGNVIIKRGEGGGSAPSGGGEWLYVDYTKISQVSEMGFMLLGYTYVAKFRVDGNIIIRPLAFDFIMGTSINDIKDNIVAIAIGGGMKIGDTQSGLASLVEQVKGLPNIDSCLITEAEFYDLNS